MIVEIDFSFFQLLVWFVLGRIIQLFPLLLYIFVLVRIIQLFPLLLYIYLYWSVLSNCSHCYYIYLYSVSYGNRQQATLAKFTTWDARNKFFKARKGSNFYVKADLTKKKENSLTYARDGIRPDPGVRKFVKYVYVDPNCNLMAFTATGRFMRFNSECAFDSLLSYVDNTTRGSENVFNLLEDQLQSLYPGE